MAGKIVDGSSVAGLRHSLGTFGDYCARLQVTRNWNFHHKIRVRK